MNLASGSIDSRENNLNFIRLIAAISVTFGHSFAMTHGSHYEFVNGLNSAAFGFYAVAIFFGLSGFLITQSYFRNPNWKVFLKARILRLAPGYFFANFITALLIIFLIKSDWALLFHKEFLIYIIGGSFKEKWSYLNIFQHLHYNSTNGSMWTLPYEFIMYMHVMFLGLSKVLYQKYAVLGLCILFFTVAWVRNDFLFNILFHTFFRIKTYDATYLALPLSFAVGVLLFLFKNKIKLFILPAFALLVASFFADWWLFKLSTWLYFVFCFSYIPKYYLKKLNFKNDISYGIYILSWPIQQTVLHLKLTESPVLLFLYSMIAILPLAFISWKLVEKPALKFKNTFSHN
jgi:peptidoglycan/LPS O-acetylase OafA/YrhL